MAGRRWGPRLSIIWRRGRSNLQMTWRGSIMAMTNAPGAPWRGQPRHGQPRHERRQREGRGVAAVQAWRVGRARRRLSSRAPAAEVVPVIMPGKERDDLGRLCEHVGQAAECFGAIRCDFERLVRGADLLGLAAGAVARLAGRKRGEAASRGCVGRVGPPSCIGRRHGRAGQHSCACDEHGDHMG